MRICACQGGERSYSLRVLSTVRGDGRHFGTKHDFFTRQRKSTDWGTLLNITLRKTSSFRYYLCDSDGRKRRRWPLCRHVGSEKASDGPDHAHLLAKEACMHLWANAAEDSETKALAGLSGGQFLRRPRRILRSQIFRISF